MSKDSFKALRRGMVSEQIRSRGISDERILEAFLGVPRHIFVPEEQKGLAYNDCSLPIGGRQTISQPYIVALMTLHLGLKSGESVLEIGTGSGYQAAILAFLGARVYSVERSSYLATAAKKALDSLKLGVQIKVGDGTLGWPEGAVYDRIIVTAASRQIPPPLTEQLKTGGRIVIPLGDRFHQSLTVVDKISGKELREKKVCDCVFVPLVGEHGFSR